MVVRRTVTEMESVKPRIATAMSPIQNQGETPSSARLAPKRTAATSTRTPFRLMSPRRRSDMAPRTEPTAGAPARTPNPAADTP